jgi:adenylate cyclase
MSTEIKKEIQLEIAHVLFMDIVGYSKLLINEQRALLDALNQIVRGTDEFRSAEAAGRLIKIPTGDGMALVFYNTPEAPVECALDISRALKTCPNLPLRMGVHSGPVGGVIDVNERANVAGAGINMAQRVMDCGDAGHILLSKRVAEDLQHYEHWQSHLHEVGECEVKHGVRVHIVNLYTDELGNPDVPEKFKQLRRKKKMSAAISESPVRAPAGFGPRSKPNDRVIESLAVLPLVNETADSTVEYLSEGISEGIINILSQLPSLRILARSTVFRYKGRNMDARRAGRALKVDGVLSGALFRRANQFMIKIELLNVADGTQIWGQRFTVGEAEVFNAEEIISKEIAEKLRIRLTEAQRNRIEEQNTDNPVAYRLYLQGRYQWGRRTEEGLRKAIEHFRQAIENDSGYARAWAGLADSYTVLGCWGYEAPHQCYPKAKAAAERALELDDSVAEAHTSLAVAKKDYYWDWDGAEEEYLRALKLNPNSGATRQWYGEYLACVGKHAESITELQQAQQLDPLSLIVAATAGRHGHFFARQFDRAFRELQNIVRTDPQFWIGHNFLGWVYVVKEQWQEALTEFRAAQRLDNNPETLAGIGYASALSGQQLAARQTVENLKALRTERYVQPVDIALVHAALGEEDEAFVWLEKAFEEHAQWLSEIKVDPAFDPLRSNSRFSELLKRIGLA